VRLNVPTPSDHDRLLDAEYDETVPIRVLVDQKGRVGDLVGTLWPSLYLIGDRFKKVLEQNAITGWRGYGTVSEDMPPTGTWWILGVAGRAGPVRTGEKGVPPGLDPMEQYLDPREWDGSDLFHPANEGTILVTSRAAQAIDDAHLKNVLLEPRGLEPPPN
jgi:hypothetical protein